MNVFVTIMTPLVIALGAFVAFGFARHENKRKNEKLNRQDFVARSTHTWGAVMITVETVLAILLIFGNITDPFSIGINIALVLLAVLFGYGILQNFREKIHVKGNSFTVFPAIGKKKEYDFSQIEKIEGKKTGHYVYVNGKKVATLDPAGIGTSLFVEIYKAK